MACFRCEGGRGQDVLRCLAGAEWRRQGGCPGRVGSRNRRDDRDDDKKDNKQRQACTANLKRLSSAEDGDNSIITTNNNTPDWRGSGCWASSSQVEGHWFDSQAGHRSGLWVQCLVRIWTRGNRSVFLMFLRLRFPFPSPLFSKNKEKLL